LPTGTAEIAPQQQPGCLQGKRFVFMATGVGYIDKNSFEGN